MISISSVFHWFCNLRKVKVLPNIAFPDYSKVPYPQYWLFSNYAFLDKMWNILKEILLPPFELKAKKIFINYIAAVWYDPQQFRDNVIRVSSSWSSIIRDVWH